MCEGWGGRGVCVRERERDGGLLWPVREPLLSSPGQPLCPFSAGPRKVRRWSEAAVASAGLAWPGAVTGRGEWVREGREGIRWCVLGCEEKGGRRGQAGRKVGTEGGWLLPGVNIMWVVGHSFGVGWGWEDCSEVGPGVSGARRVWWSNREGGVL